MRTLAGLLLAIALLGYAIVALPGCSGWLSGCDGPPDKLPCTCGGQHNPGCVPWNTDTKKPIDGGIQ